MAVPRPSLKILIDDGMATSRFLTGIGHHSLNLAIALNRYLPCRLTNYGPIRFVPRIFRRLIYIFAVNLFTPLRRVDVVHFQNYYLPRFRGSKRVVATIQDLTAFTFPQTLPPLYCRFARKATAQAVARSDLIIVPLHAVRDDVHRFFPESRTKKIEICPDGLRDVYASPEAPCAPLPAGLRSGAYFLTVGTIERRKNLAMLVRSFLAWKTKRGIDDTFRLVLVGQDGFGSEEIQELIAGDGPILRLRGLADTELLTLYRNCRAVIFPSLYEGFGLPLVEAMSQGAPIIASAIPTTLELNRAHGHLYRLFDRHRGEELEECMEAAHRGDPSPQGPLPYGDLSVYSYDNIARSHVRMYQSLAGS